MEGTVSTKANKTGTSKERLRMRKNHTMSGGQ